ncbi:F-box domain protein [Colletotrichum kahawae]|uniref:F-box domain protein n=1 Tax=Colletotrichum kahawae TaxID=34407 RepID=A0AAD9YPM9_COLKA|nr:F-box domain protein [Colletotrichum kahawae]
MASLATIPNEILDAILLETPTPDLVSLTQTCRNLRSISLPLAYRDIAITSNGSINNHLSRITLLLRTVLESPHLTRHIKSMRLFTGEVRRLDSLTDERAEILTKWTGPSLLASDISDTLVRKAVRETQSLCAAEWISAIFDNDLTAASALILAQCNQLESLTVDHEFARLGAKWLTAVFRHGLKDDTRPPTFGNLTKLDVTCYHRCNVTYYWDHITKELFMLSLHLPKIKSLRLGRTPRIDAWDENAQISHVAWPFPAAPDAASLTSLRLDRSAATFRSIEELLKRTPSLRFFYLDSYIPETHRQHSSILRQALHHVRGTLMHLTVKYMVSDEDYPDPDNLSHLVRGSLDTLRDLELLEELNISLCVFYGQDKELHALPPLSEGLPPKLKRLTINDSMWDYITFYKWPSQVYVPLLRAFLGGGWSTSTPELQEFALDARRMRNGTGGKFARGIRGLRNVCEEQGLNCSLPGYIDIEDDDDDDDEEEDHGDSLSEWT